jgi:AmmeMemoRadiSam system protein B
MLIVHNWSMTVPQPLKIRAATVDGLFYPARAEELRSLLDELIAGCTTPRGRAAAIIVPHAAYQFSGRLAAAAFQAAADRKVERVVLLGPVHREESAEIVLPESEAFRTPLGDVMIDQELVEELESSSTRIIRNDIPHLEEHCLEVHLPFVQQLFPAARIVPVLMGTTTAALTRILATALRLCLASRLSSTLLVVSANMTSYPCCKQESRGPDFFLERILRGDWEGILDGHARGSISSPAAGCVAAMLSLRDTLGGRIELLGQSDSTAAAEDDRNLVYYAAVALQAL